MTEACKILFVDDEAQMLVALSRVFRGKRYDTMTANSGKEAWELLQNHEFQVIVSDMRMPEMDGAELLAKCFDKYPQTRRILLTGYSDQDSTIRAINQGKIHQYISKPWDNDKLREAVDAEILLFEEEESQNQQLKKQVDLVSLELEKSQSIADMAKEELLGHYQTTIKVISHLVHLRSPHHNITNAVVSHCQALAKLIKLDQKVVEQLNYAARLYQLGKLALPDTLMNKCFNDYNKDELKEYRQHPATAANLLIPVKGLDLTSRFIRYQAENYNGSGPNGLAGNKIPLGSRILRLVNDYQMLIHGHFFKDYLSSDDAVNFLTQYSGTRYDAELLKLYVKLIDQLNKSQSVDSDHLITKDSLEAGQVISRDLISPKGVLLITKNSKLTNVMAEKLKALLNSCDQEMNIFIKPNKTS
jgi:response regulator RpfG family c-di-GMP phosphodiesterase